MSKSTLSHIKLVLHHKIHRAECANKNAVLHHINIHFHTHKHLGESFYSVLKIFEGKDFFASGTDLCLPPLSGVTIMLLTDAVINPKRGGFSSPPILFCCQHASRIFWAFCDKNNFKVRFSFLIGKDCENLQAQIMNNAF